MRVDGAEARHAERVLRDAPGEAGAEQEIRVERAQERRDPILGRGDDDVEPLRRVADELVEA